MKIKDPISTTEAARIMGVAATTVRKWTQSRRIKSVRIGNNNFVSRRTINWMKKIKDAQESEGGSKWQLRKRTTRR